MMQAAGRLTAIIDIDAEQTSNLIGEELRRGREDKVVSGNVDGHVSEQGDLVGGDEEHAARVEHRAGDLGLVLREDWLGEGDEGRASIDLFQ